MDNRTPHQTAAHLIADALAAHTDLAVETDFRTNTFFMEGPTPGTRIRVVALVENSPLAVREKGS
jgi:hypothetical protein